MHQVGYAVVKGGGGAQGDLEAEGAAEALRQNTSSILPCYRLAMQQHLERELHQCT